MEARSRILGFLATAALITIGAGCSSINDGEVFSGSAASLEGTWQYLITNAYDSVFVGCTGDAAALEGLSFAEGMAAAPICVVSNTFEVTQSDDTLVVAPHQVSCGDGSSAQVTANVTLIEGSLAGLWMTASDAGVDAIQSFSASVMGEMLEFTESHRSFDGNFSGSCDLVPALTATGRIL